MDVKKTTLVWASRDPGKNVVKIWLEEPKLVEPNNVFVSKIYLGHACIEQWPGPDMAEGQVVRVAISAKEVI